MRSPAHRAAAHISPSWTGLKSNARIFSDSMKIVSSQTATTGSTRHTSTAWGRTAITGSATRPGSSSTPPGTRGWTPSVGTSSRGSEESPAGGMSASWMWFTIQVGYCQVCDKLSSYQYLAPLPGVKLHLYKAKLDPSFFWERFMELWVISSASGCFGKFGHFFPVRGQQ